MSLILRVARLIDGTGRDPLENATVVIDEGRITSVATDDPRPTGDDRIVDLDGCTLMPGLIDSHVHLCWDAVTPLPELTLRVLALAQDALRHGVTTMRDVGGRDGVAIALRRAIARGQVEGPHLLCAGRAIIMTGGHGWQEGFTVEADGVEGVVQAVRTEVRNGADFIKLCTTHRAPRPEFTQEELCAAVTEAHRLDRRVACHASTEPGVGMAVAAGVDSVEHGALASEETLALMAEGGIGWVPSLAVMGHGFEAMNPYSQPPLRLAELLKDDVDDYADHRQYFDTSAAWLRDAVSRAHALGICIGAGTDAPLQNLPYHAVHNEVMLLVGFGLDPMAALLAATANNARLLGIDDKTGRIKPGMVADLVAVAGDPLADISAVRDVVQVIHRGRVVGAAKSPLPTSTPRSEEARPDEL